MRYSTPIDVSDNTKNDTLIELMATPEIEGIKEFTEFDIRLYDMNNPDIWINFNFENAAWGYEHSMMLAVSTSTTEGVTFGNRWTYGGTDATWQRSIYTHLGACHTYGKVNNTRVSVTKLYYDATENAVYARTYHDWNMDGFLTCLLDLDDPNQVGQNYVWSGFPSGKAYMEITATPSQEAHMLVFKVDDRKLSGTDMEGAYTTSIEVKAPEELFKGVVGAEYPIFEASASDSYGNVFDKLNVSVYMDQLDGQSVSRRYFPLKAHSFETPIAGEYTIEYSFLDYYGVEKNKKFSVIVEAEDATLEYIPSSSIKTEYKVGEKIYLLNGEIEGAVGDYSIEKSVYFTATGETARQEVKPTDNGMGPFVSFEATGSVEIEVIVIDALGRSVKEVAYEFNVVYPDQIMINTPSLPVAVFKDQLFTLPNVTAVAYQNGQKIDAEVLTFVNDQNVSNTMTYTPTTTDSLAVSYRSENGDVLFEGSVQVKEKNATVFADNYFVFDNMQSQCFTNESGSVEYRLSAIQAGLAKASFIKKLSADILSMSFDVMQGKEAESISVRLVDSVNADESVLCTLKKGEKAGKAIAELYLNGASVRAGIMEGSIDGATSALLNIGYDSKTFAITDVMGNRVAKIATYENGDVFHGFSSGYAYVNVEFHNVAADYQIVWTSLSNQTFTDSFVDTTAPMKSSMRKRLFMLGAFCAATTLSFAVSSLNDEIAKADTATPDASQFYMQEGAAVRTNSNELGIRFGATITQEYWQTLQTTYGEDATYSFYSIVTDDTNPVTKDYGTLTPDFTESDSYTFYSTIVYTTAELESAGLLDEACELALSAQTYVDVTQAGATEPITIAAYGTTGKRSMKAVANAAVLAGETDEDLAKYFTVGKRSEKIEGYSFTDKSGGIATMTALSDLTETTDFEMYYGAEKVDATYANGTISFAEIPFEAKNPYISVFTGGKVYSTKVAETIKIAQAQVDDGTLFNAIQTGSTNAPACIYLAENIDLASYISKNGWQPTTPFIGAFDGGNHAIDNLTTSNINDTSYGFFRRFTGTLKNVAFTNVTVNANSGVISDRFVENTQTYIENVFIKVTKTGNASSSSRYAAITERADKTGHVTLTNVVVSMPGTAPNESLFGNVLKTTAHINDVYTIGLKTTKNFPYTENDTLNTPPEKNVHAYYADLTAFTKGTKTLTPFLENCVETYLPVVKIYTSNVGDLKTLQGGEYVILMEDIDLKGATWEGAGNFVGTLDGDGCVIKNFALPAVTNGAGFFVTATGTIKNVGFANVTLGAGASILAARNGSGTLTVENVFIDVDSFADATSTNAIISKVRSNEASVVTLTSVVASMPSANAKIFGTELKYETRLTNVYTIGIPKNSRYPSGSKITVNPTEKDCDYYADLNAFETGTKTLTQFLSDCVGKYVNA